MPTENQGRGSIHYALELYLDEKSNIVVAFTPAKLHTMIHNGIAWSNMHILGHILDPLGMSFHSLQESHVLFEPWPERMFLLGDVRLCHFSRDNTAVAQGLVRHYVRELDPARVIITALHRGPGPFRVEEPFEWQRGEELFSRLVKIAA